MALGLARIALMTLKMIHNLSAPTMKAAVFLERDGLLNLCETRQGQQLPPLSLQHFRVNSDAAAPLARLKQSGLVVIVTTNQPAVQRGELSRHDLAQMHARLRRLLPVDDIMLCPYDDPSHPCHKPHPGQLLEAAFRWGLDLERSFVISDKWADAKAARLAGCTSVMVESPWLGDDHHEFVVADLEAAVCKVEQLHHGIFTTGWAQA
jgi:histidinol-phosphate phosphatase family protein